MRWFWWSIVMYVPVRPIPALQCTKIGPPPYPRRSLNELTSRTCHTLYYM